MFANKTISNKFKANKVYAYSKINVNNSMTLSNKPVLNVTLLVFLV
jgi:hypothetical protein